MGTTSSKTGTGTSIEIVPPITIANPLKTGSRSLKPGTGTSIEIVPPITTANRLNTSATSTINSGTNNTLVTLEKPLIPPTTMPTLNRTWQSNKSHINYSKKNNVRKRVGTLGKGVYGEAILETILKPNKKTNTVVTKYFIKPKETVIENTGEIAILKYLQGLPHVSQIIKMSAKNSEGRCKVFPCLVMKAEKTSLINLMGTELEWDTIFQLCIDILQGYNVLHSLGIVHGDTKPNNILITESTNAVITDFGLSVFTLPTILYNQNGNTGTIWYSSPEVLMRKWLQPYVYYTYTYKDGLAQDAWAVGIVLFYLLTGSDIFFSKIDRTIEGQLLCILRAKGTITKTDGDIYTLLDTYYNIMNRIYHQDSANREQWTDLYNFIFFSKPPTPSIKQILEETIPSDSSCRILIPIVLGLLEYNLTTRFTISKALNDINENLSSTNKPLIIIDTPKSNFDIGSIAAVLFKLPPPVDLPASYLAIETELNDMFINMFIDKRTKHILFDRACLFLLQLVHTFKIDFKQLNNYHYTVILLAYALFDCTRKMDRFNELLAVFTKKQNTDILSLLKEILLLDVQFLGKTFLDKMLESMLESMNPLTPEKIKRAHERAHEINKYCLYNNVYTKLLQSHTPEKLVTFSSELANSEKLVTFLSEFANSNKSVESINAPPPPVPSVGGNRPRRKRRTPKKPRRSATRRKRAGV